jgi:FtsP/CotA-like multicopper oxidase with cupredoxin domain
VRIRLINAAADTVFKVALGGHTLTVTHADGYPVVAAQARAVYIGMGERYDMTVTLGSGVFPLVARPEGKSGVAFAVVRTAAGSAPAPTSALPELDGNALLATGLTAADSVRLSANKPDRTLDVQLNGQMKPYAWGINGRQYGQDTPLSVRPGQRLRLRMTNMTTMVHPMHIHGHVWGLPASGGLRKDTVLVLPMQTIEADLQADNPGVWAYHCHNQYHAETGMMTTLRYT